MSAFPTNFRDLLRYDHPAYHIAGTDLAVTLYGPASRFAVYEVRDAEGGTNFRVHDAAQVTDAQVRDGGSAPPIADALDWDAVEALVAGLVAQDAAQAS